MSKVVPTGFDLSLPPEEVEKPSLVVEWGIDW
jgi:hypothetical protein